MKKYVPTEVDLAKARRAVKNFNARIDYLVKKHPENIEYFPVKMSMKKLRALGVNRREFLKYVNQLERFKGKERKLVTENNVTLTKWEMKIRKREANKINKQKQAKQEQPIYINGIKLENAQRIADERDKKFRQTVRQSKEARERLQLKASKRFEKESRNVYKENIIKALKKVFNKDDANILVDLVNKITPDKLNEMYQMGFEIAPSEIYLSPESYNAKFEYYYEMFNGV